MKKAILTIAAITLASGGALAAPSKSFNRGHDGRGNITPYERVVIAKSAQRLSFLKHRAWADGKLSFFERFQIRQAEARHAALVSRARRT
jgi:hypothetical protein